MFEELAVIICPGYGFDFVPFVPSHILDDDEDVPEGYDRYEDADCNAMNPFNH